MSPKRSSLTPEQRQAQAQELHEQIVEQVSALKTSEGWMNYLKFAASFHSYSFNNLMLILGQNPDASQVAGYRQWQKLGRQVRQGERGIKIFGYSTVKRELEPENPAEEPTTVSIPRFPVLTVFDISQTDLVDGHEDPPNPVVALAGEDSLGVVAAVTDYLSSRGWDVNREATGSSAYGYASPNEHRVVISDSIDDAQAAKTSLHEAAHIILDHVSKDDYQQHRGIYETEAESVAYITAGLLGIDTSSYSVGYIAGWARDEETIIDTAKNVLAASTTLYEAITEPVPESEAAPAPSGLGQTQTLLEQPPHQSFPETQGASMSTTTPAPELPAVSSAPQPDPEAIQRNYQRLADSILDKQIGAAQPVGREPRHLSQ